MELTTEQKAEIVDWLASIKESLCVGLPDDSNANSDDFEILIKTTRSKAVSNRAALDNFMKAIAKKKQNAEI